MTFLGAHVVPPEYEGRRRRLRRARLRRDARRVRAARALDRRVLRGAARSTPTSRARCSRPAATPGSGCACTPTSSATAPASSSRSSWAPRRPTTAPTCRDADVDALAGSDTVATLPARRPTSPPASRYPDARRADRRRRRPSPSPTNCNPGSSYTTSMAFCIALAVRDMRMTPEEALRGRDRRRRPCAAPRRRRPARARRPRRRGRARRALATSTSSTGRASRWWARRSSRGAWNSAPHPNSVPVCRRERLEAPGPSRVVVGVRLTPRCDAHEVVAQTDIGLTQRECPGVFGACPARACSDSRAASWRYEGPAIGLVLPGSSEVQPGLARIDRPVEGGSSWLVRPEVPEDEGAGVGRGGQRLGSGREGS